MRLIDADKIVYSWQIDADGNEHDGVTLQSIIDKMPTIEERKKGTWIDYSDEGYVECPFCHSATNCDDNIKELHFCFSCGADMRGTP